MNLLHLIVRQWRQRPARTALSIASVAIAAAAVLGVTLAQTSVRMAYRELLAVTDGRPAIEIVAAEGGRFDPAAAPSVVDIEGVRSSMPLVTRATMARASGKRFRGVLLGVDPNEPQIWEALPLVEGRPCQQDDEALLSADLAKRLKVGVGERLVVLGSRGPRSAKIVGLVNSAALGELAPAATLVMPLPTVQSMYRLAERVNRIRIELASSDAREQLQEAVAAAARRPGRAGAGGADGTGRRHPAVDRDGAAFRWRLSLAMAAFIVLNTLRMNFGERRRDMAVLRVLGVTSRQLAGLLVAEGLTLGLVGALLGIPAGLALGRGLAVLMQRLAEAEIPAPEIPYWTLAAALVVGPLVAGLAALVPALQWRGISPAEALGDAETRRGERFPWWSVIGGAAVWVAAVALLVLVGFERLNAEAAIPAGVLMLVGFVAVIPARPDAGGSFVGTAISPRDANRRGLRRPATAPTTNAHRAHRWRAGRGHQHRRGNGKRHHQQRQRRPQLVSANDGRRHHAGQPGRRRGRRTAAC